ncbi:MAG: IspD/TarI family cytidylyltransferase [Candidatus Gastranaerophilales bacterium]|nr:IspD/TarI family cytidylyltransferase [Candidatus Gastranaerophilales bacterium]
MNILKNNRSKTGVAAVITAGGMSNRFGSNKLLENLANGESVICTTIKKFIPLCDTVVIPCRADVQEHIKSCFKNDLEKIIFAPFGDTRQKSVFSGLSTLAAIENRPKTVLIHDGARPFVETDTIKETVEKLKIYKGVCVGIYATDTIKITDKDGNILKTIDRTSVFQAQTPQGFDFNTIFEAHKKLQNKNFTDDCCLLEALNIPVYALTGTLSNKKITFREDINF